MNGNSTLELLMTNFTFHQPWVDYGVLLINRLLNYKRLFIFVFYTLNSTFYQIYQSFFIKFFNFRLKVDLNRLMIGTLINSNRIFWSWFSFKVWWASWFKIESYLFTYWYLIRANLFELVLFELVLFELVLFELV